MTNTLAILLGVVGATVLVPLALGQARRETATEPRQRGDGKYVVWPGWVAAAAAVGCVLLGPISLALPIGDTPVVVVVTGTIAVEVLALAFLFWVLRTRVEYDASVVRARYLRSGWICMKWGEVVRLRSPFWSASIVLEDRLGRRMSLNVFMRGTAAMLCVLEQQVPESADGKETVLRQARRHVER